MTPKERINAIRLMEKMRQHPEFSGRLGVEIRFVDARAEQEQSTMERMEPYV